MLERIITEYILIPIAHGQADGVTSLLSRINEHLINPLIVVLFAVAFVQFVIGLFKFFGNRDNQDALETGKRHMLWGVIGMAIMVSVFGIMGFLTSTIGVGDAGNNLRKGGGSGDVTGLFQNN